MVDEFDGEDFDLRDFLEGGDVDVLTFRDVEEHTIDEEEERFNIQELAPWQTQVEEELGKSLIVDALLIHIFSLHLLRDYLLFTSHSQSLLLLIIHELFIFFVEILIRWLLFRFLLLYFLKISVRNVFVLLLLLLLSLHIDLPVLFSRLASWILVEIQNQTLLNLYVQVDVLLFSQPAIVLLLHEHEPLREDALELHSEWQLKSNSNICEERCRYLPECDSIGLSSFSVLRPRQSRNLRHQCFRIHRCYQLGHLVASLHLNCGRFHLV